ncbi:MAG: DUF2125 domain-containing protein [Pseudomonadota bacterium]
MDALRSRLGLIIPFALFGAFTVVYTIIWTQAASAVRAGIDRVIEAETAAGRTFDIGQVKMKGYPFSLRGVLTDVIYEHPGLVVFEAEEVMLVTLPLSPSRVIASPRGEQAVTFGGERYDLETEDFRISVEEGFTALETHGATLTGDDGTMTITTLIGNVQQLAEGSTLALGVRGFLREGTAPMDVAILDLAASIDADTLTIADLGFYVGENNGEAASQVTGEGAITFDDLGRANGQLDVTVQNQDPLIGVLASTGAIGSGEATGARLVLGLLTDNGKEAVDLPFTVKDGKMKLGPVGIGRLPSLPR